MTDITIFSFLGALTCGIRILTPGKKNHANIDVIAWGGVLKEFLPSAQHQIIFVFFSPTRHSSPGELSKGGIAHTSATRAVAGGGT